MRSLATMACWLRATAAVDVAAFERATRLRVLHASRAVVVVDKPAGLRSVPAYGPTDELIRDHAARFAAGERDLEAKFERPTRRERWCAVARELRELPPALRRRCDSLPRTRTKFLKFCGGPAGGRLDEAAALAAWETMRAAVASREVEEGMEESDSVLSRVQRDAGFVDACPVHRIDVATSGCLAVALDGAAAADLSAQWRDRDVCKTYEAVVAGVVASDAGDVDLPLRRVGASIRRQGRPSRVVVAEADEPLARASRSSYAVSTRGADRTVLALTPHTGRLHQLRAHCAALGHPILGDWLYGDGASADRLCLHASALAFRDPALGCRVEVASRSAWRLVDGASPALVGELTWSL